MVYTKIMEPSEKIQNKQVIENILVLLLLLGLLSSVFLVNVLSPQNFPSPSFLSQIILYSSLIPLITTLSAPVPSIISCSEMSFSLNHHHGKLVVVATRPRNSLALERGSPSQKMKKIQLSRVVSTKGSTYMYHI